MMQATAQVGSRAQTVDFEKVWKNYKQLRGKTVGSWIDNYCAINLFNALIQAGAPKTGKHYGETTPVEGNSLLFRIDDVKKYLQGEHLGIMKVVTKLDDIIGQKGILAFKIHFSDATGHIMIWNGTSTNPEDTYINTGDNFQKCFARSERTEFYQFA